MKEKIDDYVAERLFPNGDEKGRELISRLMEAAREGHLCIALEESGALLPPELLEEVSEDNLFPSRPLCRQGTRLYFQKNWVFESRFLHHIKRVARDSSIEKIQPPSLSAQLSPKQKEAIQNAFIHPLSVIAGGPGTGKSFTAARLVEAFLQAKPSARILLAAPTGKAAAHLSSLVGKQNVTSSTLHALLGVRGAFDFAKERKSLSADLLIVDESSMIDAALFSCLLASLKEGTRLVLMGDSEQLPAVESGSFFADLIESGKIPMVTLDRSYRSDREEILSLADAIKRQNLAALPTLLAPFKFDLDFTSPSTFLMQLWERYHKLFEAGAGFRMLSCLRKGPFGADAINSFFAERFSRKREFAQPLLITRSDSKLGICNGETALLSRSTDQVLFPDGRVLPLAALPSYEFAYCLSVHKSQGSEYDHVVLLVPAGSENFGKEMLYTAATRARQRFEVAGSEEAIAAAMQRSSRKISGLHARIKTML